MDSHGTQLHISDIDSKASSRRRSNDVYANRPSATEKSDNTGDVGKLRESLRDLSSQSKIFCAKVVRINEAVYGVPK